MNFFFHLRFGWIFLFKYVCFFLPKICFFSLLKGFLLEALRRLCPWRLQLPFKERLLSNLARGLDSALSIPIEKRDTIYSSDLLSQPKSRSVSSGTALLLLCAHSIHPPSLHLNIIYIFVLYRIYRKRDGSGLSLLGQLDPIFFFLYSKTIRWWSSFFLVFQQRFEKKLIIFSLVHIKMFLYNFNVII